MFTKSNAKALGSKGGKQSGKRDFLTQQIIAELNEIDPAQNVTKARMLVKSLVDNAVGGDLAAQREIFDRVEGKAHQTTEITVDDKRDATDWTRDELVAFLDDARKSGNGTAKTNGRANGSDIVH
jgi:hypothetical protein